jgi:hypothetical protein
MSRGLESGGSTPVAETEGGAEDDDEVDLLTPTYDEKS